MWGGSCWKPEGGGQHLTKARQPHLMSMVWTSGCEAPPAATPAARFTADSARSSRPLRMYTYGMYTMAEVWENIEV